MSQTPGILTRLASAFRKVEDYILVGLLLTMIFMAVLQIALRNIFDSGIVWGDALVRVLVLWLGLIGAMAASRTDNHISIDVVSRYLPAALKRYTRILVYLFTLAVTGLMTFHAARFVAMEKADGMIAFANVPAWICEAIIPAAFGIITIRYFFLLIQELFKTP